MPSRPDEGMQLLQDDGVVAGQMLKNVIVHHDVEAFRFEQFVDVLAQVAMGYRKVEAVALIVQVVRKIIVAADCPYLQSHRGFGREMQHPRSGADPAKFGQQQERRAGPVTRAAGPAPLRAQSAGRDEGVAAAERAAGAGGPGGVGRRRRRRRRLCHDSASAPGLRATPHLTSGISRMSV